MSRRFTSFFALPTVRLFHSTAIRRSAFDYVTDYKSIFPKDTLVFLEENKIAAEKIDRAITKFMSKANSLEEIRNIYTGEKEGAILYKEIKSLISSEVQTGANKDELINLTRSIIRWNARARMIKCGFIKEVHAIHDNNTEKYGNAIGPTRFFLNKRYGNDPKKIAEAASNRFRRISF